MPPSLILGLTPGSYEAYCLDQAVWYFGSQLTSMVEAAGRTGRKPKGQASAEAAQKRVLTQVLEGYDAPQQFADPAAFFQ